MTKAVVEALPDLQRIVAHEADLVHLSVPMCGVVKQVVKRVKRERGWPTPEEPEA